MLDKKGNSDTDERLDLLDEFLMVFPDAKVNYLTADREFVGADWFEYLLNQSRLEISIRIRESDKLFDGQKDLKAKLVFSSLQVGEHQALRRPRRLWGHWVSVAALRLEERKLLSRFFQP